MNRLRRGSMLLALACTFSHGQTALPGYRPEQQLSGLIRSCGSTAMGSMMRDWEQHFHAGQPGIQFADDLKGTASAMACVSTGAADLALIGRDVWPVESEAFRKLNGYPATSMEVATGSFDLPTKTFALMIFVHRDNPLTRLTLRQLAAVFGSAPKGSASKPGRQLRRWGELGLRGPWAQRPITLYGPAIDNDKAIFFRKIVMHGTGRWASHYTEFRDEPKDKSGSDAGAQILEALGRDRYGIAISNVHYSTGAVKPLAIGLRDGGPFIPASPLTVQGRTYPLARPVHIVFNRSPGQPADPKLKEFLRFILSREGQAEAERAGYLPLPLSIVRAQLRKLQ